MPSPLFSLLGGGNAAPQPFQNIIAKYKQFRAATAVLVPFGGSVSVGIQNVGTISTTVTNARLTIIQTAGR